MPTVEALLKSHPVNPVHTETVSRCMEACFTCVETCTACADACLSERQLDELLSCIRHDLDCAAICNATGTILGRAKGGAGRRVLEAQLTVCIAACRACGDVCRRHAHMHEHCRMCAEACDACINACNDMLAAMRQLV